MVSLPPAFEFQAYVTILFSLPRKQLILHLVNWCFYGILTAQVCELCPPLKVAETHSNVRSSDIYYLAFPSDNYIHKAIVCVSFLLQTFQTVLATYDAFRQFVWGWGNSAKLDSVGFYWISAVIMTALSGLLCRMFYASKIHALSGQFWVSAIIATVSISWIRIRGIANYFYDMFSARYSWYRIRHSGWRGEPPCWSNLEAYVVCMASIDYIQIYLRYVLVPYSLLFYITTASL